ncbi:MAG: DUF4926 domain-containing protein [Bacteroidota bacterium]|nr:DUF4926 domain-containing protein [Bacteroidota bacterium]
MKEFDIVRIITNDYCKEGVKAGDIGVILEDYKDGYFEVEFSDSKGNTILLCSFNKNELELVE